jgi:hypothetical protein
MVYSAFLNADLSGKFALVLTAYFDDSGSVKDTAATVVGGYIAPLDEWLEFDRKWRLVLKEEGIEIPFHMADFVRGTYPHFRKFKNDATLQGRVLNRLIEVILPTVSHSYVNAVLKSAYDAVNVKYCFTEAFGTMYSFCGFHCAVKARQWVRDSGYKEDDVLYIFERGTLGNRELIDVMLRNGFPEPCFQPKEIAPLQAADHVAWENHRVYTQSQTDSTEPIRESFAKLENDLTGRCTWEYHAIDSLEWLCRRFNVVARSQNEN